MDNWTYMLSFWSFYSFFQRRIKKYYAAHWVFFLDNFETCHLLKVVFMIIAYKLLMNVGVWHIEVPPYFFGEMVRSASCHRNKKKLKGLWWYREKVSVWISQSFFFISSISSIYYMRGIPNEVSFFVGLHMLAFHRKSLWKYSGKNTLAQC